MTPQFGRIHAPDPRDEKFLMRTFLDPFLAELAKLAPGGVKSGSRMYRPGPVLDQGATGTCVGHGWAGWLQGAPIMSRLDASDSPFAIYDACIKVDEFPENDNDTARQLGTSVRAGAKVLQSLGRVKSYLWASSVEDVRQWHLAGLGTVVFGVNWYTQMMQTDSHGFVRVGGSIAGGHCVKSDGWDDDKGVRIQNSWGRSWGDAGKAWIAPEDLVRLLSEDGEACAAVEQKVKK